MITDCTVHGRKSAIWIVFITGLEHTNDHLLIIGILEHNFLLPLMPNENEIKRIPYGFKSKELRLCIVLQGYLPRLTLSHIPSGNQWQCDSEQCGWKLPRTKAAFFCVDEKQDWQNWGAFV